MPATILVKSPAKITNVQGKARRKTGKVLNLASTYGMGGKAAGEKLGFEGPSAAEEGEKLLDNFFRGFPAVYVAIDESKKKLQRDGFVSGLLGRRRHLPWVNDPDYEVKPMDASSVYNPFLNCNKPKPKSSAEIFWEEVIKMYVNKSKSKDGLKNNEYERLAKLAANPYLWDKPCADKAQIESLTKRKAKVKDIAQYVKHSYTRRQALDNSTLETFEYTAYSLEKDEQGELKIMTNREKLLAYNKAYRKAHPEKWAYKAATSTEMKLKRSEYNRKYYAKNKEKIRAYHKAWIAARPGYYKLHRNKAT